jgi:hypothetical protein
MSERILPHALPNAFGSEAVLPNLNPHPKPFDPFMDACIQMVRCLKGFIQLTTHVVRRIFRSFPRHAVRSNGILWALIAHSH